MSCAFDDWDAPKVGFGGDDWQDSCPTPPDLESMRNFPAEALGSRLSDFADELFLRRCLMGADSSKVDDAIVPISSKADALQRLNACKSDTEWNATCDAVKRWTKTLPACERSGDYPRWWFAEVIQTGLVSTLHAKWA